MSFSSSVKEELSKIQTLNNKELVKNELIGYLITNNIEINNNIIKFSTESQYNINRFSKLLSNLDIQEHDIDIQGKIYTIIFEKSNLPKEIIKKEKIVVNNKNLIDETSKRAIVRGAFLGSGSINNPENKYHLEIIFSNKENGIFIVNVLKEFNIEFKILETNGKVSMYSKEGETISNFLAFIGASFAMLKFEEIRVVRDMKNKVNRLVNCETANLNKTINASLKQIEDIKLIKEKNKFKNLSQNLQEIAELRIKNPEASLVELGNMLKNPVGKSGVSHRLKTISEIADEIRNEEIE